MWSKIVKNTLWLTGGELVGRLLRAVVVIFAARILGAAGWGIFSYVIGLAALFTIFTDIGLGAVLTREIVRFPEIRVKYFSTSLAIKIFLLIVSSVVIIFLSPYFTKIEVPRLLIIFTALLVIFDSLRIFSFAITRALEKMHIEAAVQVITQLMIVVLGTLVLVYRPSTVNLGAAYAIGSAIGFFAVFWKLRGWFRQMLTSFDRGLAKRIFSVAWPFALLGLLGSIVLNTDIIMLGWLRGAEDIGYYSAGQKIIAVLYIVPAMVAAAAFPTWTRLANQDRQAFSQVLIKALKIVFMVALPLAIGGIITGSEMIKMVFGSAYQPSVSVFRILLLTLITNYPTTIIGNALFAYDKQKEFIKYAALGAISNVVLNFLLIPRWGIEGAAVSTVITQLISISFIWFKMKKTNNFSLRRQLNKILLVNLVTGAAVWGMHQSQVNFFVILASATTIYLAALYLFRESTFRHAIEMLWLKKV